MEFKYIDSVDSARSVFPILKELRTHLDEAEYLRLLKAAQETGGYKLLAAFDQTECTGLMGYRIIHDFVHGRHLYVDDLVVREKLRSKGLGSAFLAKAKALAAAENCTGLRLCTGAENADGRRFYEKNGWALRAVAYKIKL